MRGLALSAAARTTSMSEALADSSFTVAECGWRSRSYMQRRKSMHYEQVCMRMPCTVAVYISDV